jgi:hypothetical protein
MVAIFFFGEVPSAEPRGRILTLPPSAGGSPAPLSPPMRSERMGVFANGEGRTANGERPSPSRIPQDGMGRAGYYLAAPPGRKSAALRAGRVKLAAVSGCALCTHNSFTNS